MTDAPWQWSKGGRVKGEDGCDFHGSTHANYGLLLETDEAFELIKDKDLLQERSLQCSMFQIYWIKESIFHIIVNNTKRSNISQKLWKSALLYDN